jgi:hypothetical protein
MKALRDSFELGHPRPVTSAWMASVQQHSDTHDRRHNAKDNASNTLHLLRSALLDIHCDGEAPPLLRPSSA